MYFLVKIELNYLKIKLIFKLFLRNQDIFNLENTHLTFDSQCLPKVDLRIQHRILVFFLLENGIEESEDCFKVSDNQNVQIIFSLDLSIHKFSYYVLHTKFSKDPYQHQHKIHIS